MATITLVIRDTAAGVHVAATPSFAKLMNRVKNNADFSQAELYALAALTHIRKMSAAARIKADIPQDKEISE